MKNDNHEKCLLNGRNLRSPTTKTGKVIVHVPALLGEGQAQAERYCEVKDV